MLTIKKYNRTKAVEYALEYSLKRNNKYHDYTNEGGNCTNFASQVLYAGCNVMNYSKNGWYYLSAENTSISWANVVPFYNFLISNKDVGVFGKESPLESCEVGDIIQLKFKNKPTFSHCLVVTKITNHSPKGIFVCANTRDVKNVPVSFYSYEKIRLIHILGYREKLTWYYFIFLLK